MVTETSRKRNASSSTSIYQETPKPQLDRSRLVSVEDVGLERFPDTKELIGMKTDKAKKKIAVSLRGLK